MTVVTMPCIGCRHPTPLAGARIHKAMLVTCPLCDRHYAVPDDRVVGRFPEARCVEGAWRLVEADRRVAG
jgi:hypothetical protein